MFDFGNLGLRCGEEWVPFPVNEEMDIEYWARHTATEIAKRFEPSDAKRMMSGLEKDLRRWAVDCRTRDPLAAFGWYLDGYDAATAIMELDGIVPDDTFPELSLSMLAEKMSIHDFGEPDVRRVQLPIGASVRIRQNAMAARKGLFASRPVVRMLIYVVRPRETEVALTMYVTWRDAVIDEPVTEVADDIAQTLVV